MPESSIYEQDCLFCEQDDPAFEAMPEHLMAVYVKLGGEPPSGWDR